ncbi:DUF7504 family protein [Halobacterium rubrum]|uniref:DUF7504 family protein n=1 Tax=Halobacterium TaxID=2239 RepID=UPI001F1FFED9|nr:MULTISPECIES: hypothetical protein [Halobacterium]MDH5020314.1 hypothetical protein [Halobacterium rubrum]
MEGGFTTSHDGQAKRFPDVFETGVTVLVLTDGAPTEYCVTLDALATFGTGSDTAVIITTATSPTRAVKSFAGRAAVSERPALKLIDTTGDRPAYGAPYDEVPVRSTTGPRDLERLLVALADHTDTAPSSPGRRHLIVRSLSPLLDANPPTRLSAVLDDFRAHRSSDGLCLFGLDYTNHDTDTIATLSEHVDGVLRVQESGADKPVFDYQSTTTFQS